VVHAKMLRLELLKVKALERELEGLRPRLLKVRPRRALGLGARRLPRSLGAPGARAARRAGGLVPATLTTLSTALLKVQPQNRPGTHGQ
jgi:hypothetical protein